MKSRRDSLFQLVEVDCEHLVRKLTAKARLRGFYGNAASEIASLAFEHLLLQIHKGNLDKALEHDNPKQFLFGCLLRVCFDDAIRRFLKNSKNPKHEEIIIPVDIFTWFDTKYLQIDLWREIQILPEQQKIAIIAFYFEDMQIREIAKRLDKTEDAVKMLLHRARKSLFDKLNS